VLLVLMGTSWLILTGTQIVRNMGDLARFGQILFQILAPLQLAVALLFAALLTASAVAQEKDRRTLVLLLLTNLTNAELAVGKLLASLLTILVMLAAGLPVFLLAALLGGVSFSQIARVFGVTLVSVFAAGSLGSTVALWREKTFQALAMTALALVFYLAVWEMVAAGLLGQQWWGHPVHSWSVLFSPWQAVLEAARPSLTTGLERDWFADHADDAYVVVAGVVTLLLNGLATARVRVWNPTRTLQLRETERAAVQAAGGGSRSVTRSTHGSARQVWDNPILWREVCTWAYGRKVLVVRALYLLLCAGVAWMLLSFGPPGEAHVAAAGRPVLPAAAMPIVPLLVVSLVLVNALAVTSLTTERDGRAIDLLLVSDLTPGEFIFGKLGGVFYNTKEMVLLPMLLCAYLWYGGRLSGENLFYLLCGLAVMNLFVAVLGIHVGMIYHGSRTAIGVSLGTVLFLFIGVATCLRMMIAFSGSFHVQLGPFLGFMLGGGVGLYMALGHRNPSPAIGLATFVAPFATFYVITSFIIGFPLAVFLVSVLTYGFATAAMLVPALYEFDVATGRTTADHQ